MGLTGRPPVEAKSLCSMLPEGLRDRDVTGVASAENCCCCCCAHLLVWEPPGATRMNREGGQIQISHTKPIGTIVLHPTV
jgi:hypothetical protein